MDSRQLRYFVRVVETGSFTRAAAVLHIAQSALSLHIRNLEEELGVPLLVRSRTGVEPTDHGRLLLEHGRTILRQFDLAHQEVTSLGKEPYGDVYLGMPATVAPVLVRPLLRTVQENLPKVVPHIVEAMSGYLLEWLHSGRLDAAVLFDVQQLSGLRRSRIGKERMYLVGPAGAFPAGHLVTLAEATKHPLIIPGRMHGMNLLISNAARQQNLSLDVRVEVDSVAEMISLVKAGFGYTLLARMGFYRELQEGNVSVAQVHSPAIERTLVIATAEARPVSRATDAMIEAARAVLTAFIMEEPGG